MVFSKKLIYAVFASVMLAGAGVLAKELFLDGSGTDRKREGTEAEVDSTETVSTAVTTSQPTKTAKTFRELVDQYGSLPLIDAHNHDAVNMQYEYRKESWKKYSVDQVVLFGNSSEQLAEFTDGVAWKAYTENPETVVPFFSGFNLHDPSSLDVVRRNLEQGFFGLGEIAAASTYSPVMSVVEWKAEDPMDGYLPQIYQLCAEYKVPLLLHIDPPSGYAARKLGEAAEAYPDTVFIFAHANAYNSPDNIRELLKKHPNIYADFFAGFTAINRESSNKLEDFVPVMKEFPERFMVSTDSGYGLPGGEDAAIEAIYRLLDALGDRDITKKIAFDNLASLIRNQPATKTQIEAIRKLNKERLPEDLSKLSKAEAGMILYRKGTSR